MIDYLGIVAIIFFYLLILVVGIWAGRKAKDVTSIDGDVDGEQTEEVMLAGRNIGTLVGIFTMTGNSSFQRLMNCYTVNTCHVAGPHRHLDIGPLVFPGIVC